MMSAIYGQLVDVVPEEDRAALLSNKS